MYKAFSWAQKGASLEGFAVKIINFWLTVALLCGGTQAIAMGGWSSGGGQLIKDSHNPWFLNNTTHVNYCIEVDSENFGVSTEVIKTQIKRAISFWQKEFKYAILPAFDDFGPLKVASQTFKETKCDENTSLVFQFGRLSDDQKAFLKRPSQYAAIAVRTDYDETHLRGRGFIYVSPVEGPLAFGSGHIDKDIWAYEGGNLLYLTLIHELGHVFGLPDSGTLGDLMSENFVESILLSKQSVFTYEPQFFSLKNKTKTICPDPILLSSWQSFFGTQSIYKCFKFTFEHPLNNSVFGQTFMNVYASVSSESPMSLITSVELALNGFFPILMNTIWLSESQKVFTALDLEKQVGLNKIMGTSGLSISKKGHFDLSEGKGKRLVKVRFEQGRGASLFIEGIHNFDIMLSL